MNTKIEIAERPYGARIEIIMPNQPRFTITVNEKAGSLIVNCEVSIKISPSISNEIAIIPNTIYHE